MLTVAGSEPSAAVPGELHFGSFRLLGPHGPLFANGRVVELPRKPLALLWMLARRAGEVVSKDEILNEVWPQVVVSEGVVSATLRDLRRALGDDVRVPRYIATAHRIGYRFIAAVTDQPGSVERRVSAEALELPPPEPPAAHGLVGRAAEQARLMACYRAAAAGQRQLVFVTGEAGIGKTRLVESFLAHIEGDAPAGARIGHGQCIEHYGAGEPYLPILEAVTRLGRQDGHGGLLALLRQHAPTWVPQLPGLFGQQPQQATPHAAGSLQRMLREMADAIDLAAADQLLVLVLEDMHWSDRSTVDWLTMLAHRRERARLLVIATCRPVELIVNEHPLKQVKQELVARHAASEIALARLGTADVHDYVALRLRQHGAVPDLAAAVMRRSQGLPLFMVHLTDELQRQPDAAATLDRRPPSGGIAELIESQVARLAPQQRETLEAASVAGAEFATDSVAAALQHSPAAVEQVLETLARQGQFIEARGLVSWHDGTVGGRYGFRHDLVREGLYRRLGSARRARLHGAIGTRLALAYGAHASDIAAELALHFESAQDPWRGAQHRREAGGKALQRYAHREALTHAGQGLALLAAMPPATPGLEEAELQLRLIKGAAQLAVCGFGAPEVEATYTRALALGIALQDTAAIGPALSGLYNLYLTRAAFAQVQRIADQVMAQLRRQPDPVLTMLAHNVLGSTKLFVGGGAAALEHVDKTLALYQPAAHGHLAASYGEDPAIASHHYAALARWVVGDAEAAEHHLVAGFTLARRLLHPFGDAQMLWVEAVIALDDGDLGRVDRATATLDALCAEHGFALWQAGGWILRGAALAGRGQHEEGRQLTDAGLRAWHEAGTLLTLPHALAVAARVQVLAGRVGAAARLLDEALALAQRTGEHWYGPELHRLQGEVSLLQPEAGARDAAESTARAAASFERAIAQAQAQRSRLFELRATVSLASLALPAAQAARARNRLAVLVADLGERTQRRDLAQAAALLQRAPQLSRQTTAEITPRS